MAAKLKINKQRPESYDEFRVPGACQHWHWHCPPQPALASVTPVAWARPLALVPARLPKVLLEAFHS